MKIGPQPYSTFWNICNWLIWRWGWNVFLAKVGKVWKLWNWRQALQNLVCSFSWRPEFFTQKLLQFKFVAQLDYHIFHHPVKRDWRSNIHDNVWMDWSSIGYRCCHRSWDCPIVHPFHKLLGTGGKTHIISVVHNVPHLTSEKSAVWTHGQSRIHWSL